ncbi:hypothetical protein ABBQ38_005740 [Trebouxia sp. C0009 RCD-2024]
MWRRYCSRHLQQLLCQPSAGCTYACARGPPACRLQHTDATSTLSARPDGQTTSTRWPLYGVIGAALAGAATVYLSGKSTEEVAAAAVDTAMEAKEELQQLVNWSGTHHVRPKRFYQPETIQEVEDIVQKSHEQGQKLRCVGSALSPNGLAFSKEGMLSLALLDKVLHVDVKKAQVTVQAGARVQEVVEALRPHGLTLQNFASIREQAIGGFIQVGAHGTGATIPPVDEQVVAMKLVTPALGTLQLSEESDRELFHMARVGLGSLGVVTEVTLQCVPAHELVEHTYVTTSNELRQQHAQLLRNNKHVRYMWIPYTHDVVVVTNNPLQQGWWARLRGGPGVPKQATPAPRHESLAALRQLLLKAKPKLDKAELAELSVTQLRDELLACDPVNTDWVVQINRAEAEYWRRSEGYRVGWSDQMLGFDCGGQQWVLEVAFPTGTLKNPSLADLQYVEELLARIERQGIPAPSPIEQRWTSSSRSALSPASTTPELPPDTLFSWVGVIMYLPTEDEEQRKAITNRFREYVKLCHEQLMPKYKAVDHWAKVEVVDLTPEDKGLVRKRMADRYPVTAFNNARKQLDPNNIFSNHIIDDLFPHTDVT